MKKIFASLWIGIMIVAISCPQVQAASLYDYYQSKNSELPSLSERALEAFACGMDQYSGTAEQNMKLESCLKGKEGQLGFSVATGYQKTLRTSMDTSQSYIPMSSMALPDSTLLNPDLLGSQIFIIIEPGKTKQEIAVCTTLSTSTLNFTGCTRGLAFQGTSLVAVSGNAKTHTAGSFAAISNVHYVYDQLVDRDSSETVSGTKRFADNELIFGDGTTTGGKKLYFCDSASTSTCGYIKASPSTTASGLEDFYLSLNGSSEFLLNASGTTYVASSTTGIFLTGGAVGINVSTTGGLMFDQTTGYLQVRASSTKGIATDVNGTYVDTTDSFNWTGTNTFTTTTIATSTITTSSISHLNLRGFNTDSLVGQSSTTQHWHMASSSAFSTSTSASTKTLTVAHGLTDIPKKIRISLTGTYTATDRFLDWSQGVWDNPQGTNATTTQSYIAYGEDNNSAGDKSSTFATSYANAYIGFLQNLGVKVMLQTIDATNMVFQVDANAQAETFRVLWEAED